MKRFAQKRLFPFVQRLRPLVYADISLKKSFWNPGMIPISISNKPSAQCPLLRPRSLAAHIQKEKGLNNIAPHPLRLDSLKQNPE